MRRILITICARGGSKGIPGKNIKVINGKHLIYYTIKTAIELSEKYNADLALSTDNTKIKEVAELYGLKTNYFRPPYLAVVKAGKIPTINHILEFEEKQRKCKYDFVIDLDVTSPLRTINDLQSAFLKLESQDDAINIFSVSRAKRNPYFNMFEKINKNGFVSLVKNIGNIKSRQDVPDVYDMNASFYIYRREYFEYGYEAPVTDKSLVFVVPHICFDLDEPEDFVIMEIMLREKLFDFNI